MVDLLHRSIRAQLGAEPGHGIAVLDGIAQYYVPCEQLPNSIAGTDPYTLWLAPDRALRVGGAAPDGFCVDVSDGLAIFELTGPRADALLQMASTIALPPGLCARTVFAGVAVTLYRHGNAIRLHVERHLAAYLLQWLQTAVTAFA